jgi:hypothetical protein
MRGGQTRGWPYQCFPATKGKGQPDNRARAGRQERVESESFAPPRARDNHSWSEILAYMNLVFRHGIRSARGRIFAGAL